MVQRIATAHCSHKSRVWVHVSISRPVYGLSGISNSVPIPSIAEPSSRRTTSVTLGCVSCAALRCPLIKSVLRIIFVWASEFVSNRRPIAQPLGSGLEAFKDILFQFCFQFHQPTGWGLHPITFTILVDHSNPRALFRPSLTSLVGTKYPPQGLCRVVHSVRRTPTISGNRQPSFVRLWQNNC